MISACRLLLFVAAAFGPVATGMAAQRTAGLVDEARRQLAANHLDSAAALARLAAGTDTTSATQIHSRVVLGLVAFYRGRDSAAIAEFVTALRLNPLITLQHMAEVDSGLVELWSQAQKQVLCADTTKLLMLDEPIPLPSCVRRVETRPRIAFIPSLRYPTAAYSRRAQGKVVVQAIIDSTGKVEQGSVSVVETPDPSLGAAAVQTIRSSRFYPARVNGRAVRVLVHIPLTYTIHGHDHEASRDTSPH